MKADARKEAFSTPFSRAWEKWSESVDGCRARSPFTLGLTVEQDEYLTNRLHAAFSAGWNEGKAQGIAEGYAEGSGVV